MISRYWTERMQSLWDTSERKFYYWLKVDQTVLVAREALKQIPEGTAQAVIDRTWMDAEVMCAIERRDRKIKHDLNAFVEIIRLQLTRPRADFESLIGISNDEEFNGSVAGALKIESSLASFFHDGETSYDTQEPAIPLLLLASCEIIEQDLLRLQHFLTERAIAHRGQLMMGRTHGQHAQPITFGIKCLNWTDQVNRALKAFMGLYEEIRVMKLSGAVGVYGTLGPDVEHRVGELLNLTPVVATQIVSLDRKARLVNELAVIASIVDKIAFDLWLLSQTEISEIREPFDKDAKGSSAMPHKKNPVALENIRGLSRVVRASAGVLLENVATANERDISHSSAERIALVDAFGTLDYILVRLAGVIEKMDVFPQRMRENIGLSYGTFASQQVEMWLKSHGMSAETAYRTVQRLCSQAMETQTQLSELLHMDAETSVLANAQRKEMIACFDWNAWVTHEDFIYNRAGLGDAPI